MELETYMKITFVILIAMILTAIGYAQRKAQKLHGSRFAQSANEVP